MTTNEEIRFNKGLLGVDHDAGVFEVTREKMVGFALATGETDAVYLDDERAAESEYGGIVAAPTFCNVFAGSVERPDIGLEFGDLQFHAGQAIENQSPVRPGDSLTAKTRLKEVYSKTGRSGKMVFEVWETTFTNQRGETAATVRESFVHRSKT